MGPKESTDWLNETELAGVCLWGMFRGRCFSVQSCQPLSALNLLLLPSPWTKGLLWASKQTSPSSSTQGWYLVRAWPPRHPALSSAEFCLHRVWTYVEELKQMWGSGIQWWHPKEVITSLLSRSEKFSTPRQSQKIGVREPRRSLTIPVVIPVLWFKERRGALKNEECEKACA